MSTRKELISIIKAGRRSPVHGELDYAMGPGRIRYTIPLGPTRAGPVTHWGLKMLGIWAPLEAVLVASYPEHDTLTSQSDRGVLRDGAEILAGWIEAASTSNAAVLSAMSLARVRSATPDGGDAAEAAINAAVAAEANASFTPTQLANLRARVDAELASRISADQQWYDAYGLGEGVASILGGS